MSLICLIQSFILSLSVAGRLGLGESVTLLKLGSIP